MRIWERYALRTLETCIQLSVFQMKNLELDGARDLPKTAQQIRAELGSEFKATMPRAGLLSELSVSAVQS